MKGENWTDANEGKLTPDEFFDELILKFPTLKDEILEYEPDMTHPRMEKFATYTIEQIKNKNWDELKRCFEFQESKIDSANSDLLNALTVSYCELLLLGELADEMKEIVPSMGTKLQILYRDYETYYHDLFDKSKSRTPND